MAFVDQIQGYEAGIVRNMRNSLEQARNAFARRRLYRKTVEELNSLSTRELDDLGISRADIPGIARGAVVR